MRSKSLGQWMVCAVLTAVYPATAGEGIETSFTYQGQLKENGVPANGTFDLRFDLLDNGVQIARTCVFDVEIVDGLFTVELAFGTAVFDGTPLELQVAVVRNSIIPQFNDCSPNTSDPFVNVGPPQPITAAPYCLHALSAGNGHALDAPDGNPINALAVDNAGNVGIGTTTPQARLHVAEGTTGTGVILPGLRVEQNATAPNVIGGVSGNSISLGAVGGTVGGGGSPAPGRNNRVTDDYGTVAGGQGNQAGNGGLSFQDADFATVGGGLENFAIGDQSTVAGGFENHATGRVATIGGGDTNEASGSFSTISGGFVSSASGDAATVPGGEQNSAGGDYSFAAGRRAVVRASSDTGDNNGDEGTFIWADSTFADFTSTGPNQFLIRAGGGVGINKNNPVAGALDVAGSAFFSGNIGVGTTAPERKMHVFNGDSGGTSQSAAELVVEDNSTCYLNLMAPDASERGVSFGSPASNVHGGIYYTNTGGLSFRTGGNSTAAVISANGNVSVGVTGGSNDAALHVQNTAGASRPIKCDRVGSDGELLVWARDDDLVGSVTVSGLSVSYNAFTGSHYAWSSANVDPGALVSMTGHNRRFGDRAGAEVVYGIKTTAAPNDPACLGVFTGLMEPTRELGPENPLLVAAVGNGDLCVVDRGGGVIQPGDYLISSDVPGCAMKDDPSRFPVGHIIARAAEALQWEQAPAGDGAGPKRKTISVLFGSFLRQADAASLASIVHAQQATIGALNERLSQLEKRMAALQSESGARMALGRE